MSRGALGHGVDAPTELLRSLCCPAGRSVPPAEGARRLADAGFRAAFLDRAAAHRVTGLALIRLRESPVFARLSPAVAEPLSFRWDGVRRGCALFGLESERVDAALRDAGLVPLHLKGSALSRTVYTRPGEREQGDLDLLVRAGDLKRAVRALLPLGYGLRGSRRRLLGYRRHHFHLQLHSPRGHVVELHWDLTRPGAPFRLRVESLFERSVPAPGAPPLQVPCPEHALLLTALQSVDEGFSILSRVVDTDRIVGATPDLRWGSLFAEARSCRLGPALALSLRLAASLCGTAVPDDAARRLGVSRSTRLHLALLRPVPFLLGQQARKHATAFRLLRYWLLPGVRAKLGYAALLLSRRSVDPLDWIWRGEGDGPRRGRRAAWRLLGPLKMAVLQAWLYLTSPLLLLPRATPRPD